MQSIQLFKRAMDDFEHAAHQYWIRVLSPQQRPSAGSNTFYQIIPHLCHDMRDWATSLTSLEQSMNTPASMTALAFNVDLLDFLWTIRTTLGSYEQQLVCLMLAAQFQNTRPDYLHSRDERQLRENMRTQIDNMGRGIEMFCNEWKKPDLQSLDFLNAQDIDAQFPCKPPSSPHRPGTSRAVNTTVRASTSATSGQPTKRPRLDSPPGPSSPAAQSSRTSLSSAATPSGMSHASTGATAKPARGLVGKLQSFIQAMKQYEFGEDAVRSKFKLLIPGPNRDQFRKDMADGKTELEALSPLVQDEIQKCIRDHTVSLDVQRTKARDCMKRLQKCHKEYSRNLRIAIGYEKSQWLAVDPAITTLRTAMNEMYSNMHRFENALSQIVRRREDAAKKLSHRDRMRLDRS